jgi:hypothetical protein
LHPSTRPPYSEVYLLLLFLQITLNPSDLKISGHFLFYFLTLCTFSTITTPLCHPSQIWFYCFFVFGYLINAYF